MMAPALPDIAAHYNITNQTEIAATLSVFLITFAIGPLFLAPISEMYGRTWVCYDDGRITERAMAHVRSKEVLIVGGVGCECNPFLPGFLFERERMGTDVDNVTGTGKK